MKRFFAYVSVFAFIIGSGYIYQDYGATMENL
jgi:hypothetical protein